MDLVLVVLLVVMFMVIDFSYGRKVCDTPKWELIDGHWTIVIRAKLDKLNSYQSSLLLPLSKLEQDKSKRQARVLQTSWTPINHHRHWHCHPLPYIQTRSWYIPYTTRIDTVIISIEIVARSDVWSIMMSLVSKLYLCFENCHRYCDRHQGFFPDLKVRHEFGFSRHGWAPMPLICLMTPDYLLLRWHEYTISDMMITLDHSRIPSRQFVAFGRVFPSTRQAQISYI